ncbi:MAG: phosphomannomutase/phosphoglucomutase, partial [Candidatus Pacebacteria bacterium]|nr:phosphomannomutase/phosphoglucomutase [Candidatus Paceibacterota bacterium]
MNTSIFRAYDIRGIYPTEINEDIIYKIGRAFVVYLSAENIVVGGGARESSPALYEAFARGITDQGCNVIDIGIVSTPILYFASGTLDVDGAACLTASHNTSQYNGLKLTHAEAVPIGIESGLKKIQELVEKNEFTDSANKGIITHHNSTQEYVDHFASFSKLGRKKLKMVIDPANGMGIVELPLFEKLSKNLDIITIFDNIDMSFPNHEANPLKVETLTELRKKVIEEKADLGIAFDGDADRVGFIDEKGDVVPMDYITALLCKSIL